MFALILTLLSFASPSFAHGPLDACAPELETYATLNANLYLRYLVEEGVLGPVGQVERVLGLMNRVRQRDLFDHVFEKMGPAAVVLPRMGDMIHLSEHLVQLNRGYQGLRRRCARVSDDLKANQPFIDAMIFRSEAVLRSLEIYIAERPGRDTAWVQSQILRIHEEIARFRNDCLEHLPPQSRGFWDAIDRILSP